MKLFWMFLLLFALSISSSCVIDGSFRGLYSYYKVTKNEHPKFIQKPESILCDLTTGDSIIVYKINGNELKSCLNSKSKSLIYFWSPNCGASACIPPNYAQVYCNNNNLELFIVANYYEYNKMKIDYDLDRPIFGVDTEYYGSNLTKRYMKRFKKDLLGREWMEDGYPRFLLFWADSLISTSYKIEALELE